MWIYYLVTFAISTSLSIGKRSCKPDPFPSLNTLRPHISASEQESAVIELLKRVVPQHAEQFRPLVKPRKCGENYFELSNAPRVNGGKERIIAKGSSGVEIARGISTYLRSIGAHFAWNHFDVENLPARLPSLQKPLRGKPVGRLRYMSNVCTFSYSYVWWDWSKWSAFIDWHALQGINLPLSHVGSESVWLTVWSRLGLSREDVDELFPGPAFLAWFRMGNLRKFGGPLTDNWHRTQRQLQMKIVQRMVNLGMTPVFPAFAGFVPRALKKRFPKAKISPSSKWSSFNSTYSGLDFLDPTDSLFLQIGKVYMDELKNVYGTYYHAYSADVYNEMRPQSFDPAYLATVSRSVYQAMTVGDPKAIWVAQAWFLLESTESWRANNSAAARGFMTGVPRGRLLLLDLASVDHPLYGTFGNSNGSYFGQPFVWNMLQNYGGNLEMNGDIKTINRGVAKAIKYPSTTLVGTGLTMEGINQNYVAYQFVLDRSWSPHSNLNEVKWFKQFAFERYGGIRHDPRLQEAWMTLAKSVYNYDPKSSGENPEIQTLTAGRESVGIHHPHVNFMYKRPKLHQSYKLWYRKRLACSAWNLMASAAQNMTHNFFYAQDLTDLTRQNMEYHLIDIYGYVNTIIKGIKARGNTTLLEQYAGYMLKVWDDLDTLLSANQQFMLGCWIKAARAKGKTKEESDQYEYNARNQVTLWGDQGQIVDYVKRQWSGLIKDYYRRDAATLLPIILRRMKPGTIIMSDGWRAYGGIANLPVQPPYGHQVVIYDQNFVDPLTGIEGFWSQCKRKMKAMNGTNANLLQSHLDELCWRQFHGSQDYRIRNPDGHYSFNKSFNPFKTGLNSGQSNSKRTSSARWNNRSHSNEIQPILYHVTDLQTTWS